MGVQKTDVESVSIVRQNGTALKPVGRLPKLAAKYL